MGQKLCGPASLSKTVFMYETSKSFYFVNWMLATSLEEERESGFSGCCS